jgi:hypothetical protein
MIKIPNGVGVRDRILVDGKTATEAAAYFWGNTTQITQDISKSAVTIDSSKRFATGTFKAAKDFARSDKVCGILCCVSVSCETISAILVWIPGIPGKIPVVTFLKSTSIGCQRFRDMCSADPSNPFC